MSTVERPRALTVLAVTALVASLICFIAGIIYVIQTFSTLSMSIAAGILLLISGFTALASGGIGIYSAVKIFGNKPGGVKLLYLYAVLSISFEIVKQISDVILLDEMTLNAGKLFFLFFIPVVIIVTIMAQNRFFDYTSSLE